MGSVPGSCSFRAPQQSNESRNTDNNQSTVNRHHEYQGTSRQEDLVSESDEITKAKSFSRSRASALGVVAVDDDKSDGNVLFGKEKAKFSNIR